MGKKAMLFPGQGAQKVGMGADLYHGVPAARDIYHRANAAAGMDIARLCFEGPEAELNETALCQMAILVTSVAALEALKARHGEPGARADMTAGLRLGEYTALVYAGALEFEDAVRLVRQRGAFMREASEKNPGAMLSVLGMSREAVTEVVAACREDGTLVSANFNSPGQIVLSGTKKAIGCAEAAARERGARRTVRLAVGGAFHSPLMDSAAEKLAEELKHTEIKDPKVPVVSNVSARCVTGPEEIRDLLALQLTSPVLWEDSMRFMISSGMSEALEVGPGRVLCGLLAKTDKNLTTKNVGSLADLE